MLGEAFALDVRQFPTVDQLPKSDSWEKVQEYILSVGADNRYAAEAYSFDWVDTTGKLPDKIIGSIPEAKSGVTGSHIFALMLEADKRAYKLPLVGHCTDSASNSLNALLKLATPAQYLVDEGVSSLGLSFEDFFLYAPFFRDVYPTIAYPGTTQPEWFFAIS